MVWGVSALDVDQNAEGPPTWVTNPWEIASWRKAISSRRAAFVVLRECRDYVGLGDPHLVLGGHSSKRATARRAQSLLRLGCWWRFRGLVR